MDPARWQQVEELYLAALDKKSEERAAFLERACAGDMALRQEIESLLSFAPQADGLLRAAVHDAASQASLEAATTKGRPVGIRAGDSRKLGRYELMEQIGKGGMGVVYRATDPAIGRTVAIKTILTDDQSEDVPLRARLVRESQAAGRLSHPNIVAIHDIGEDAGTAYVVMEYVDGRTLAEVMREDSTLPSSGEVLRIIENCAGALDYAHGQGVVHRDIKPANIMLQADGMVKIADFGIAKFSRGSALTQSTVPVGSPHYMAPEQWRGELATGKVDQYALAAVAYAMLAGRRPFESDSIASLAAMTLYQDPPGVVTFNSRLNPAVDGVLRKALSKTADQRYSTCGEFALALRKAWDGAAPPVPGRATSHYKQVAAVSVIFAAACLGGWLYYQRSTGGTSKLPQKATEAAPPQTHPNPIPPALQSPAEPVPASASHSTSSRSMPPVSSNTLEREGEASLKQGDYNRAAQCFTRAIATKPTYRAYFGRATAYRKLQLDDKAVADYSKAIGLNPDSAAAYYDRAICEERLGSDQAAADDYHESLKIDPTNPRGWYARGVIYLKKGGYNKAKDCFTRAIEIDKNFTEAYRNRSKAERKLNDTEAAQADTKTAIALEQEKEKK